MLSPVRGAYVLFFWLQVQAGYRTMSTDTSGSSKLVKCPECQDTHISFLETRRVTVYFRQVPEPAPDDKTVRVLVEESEGSLYEEDTQTGYAEELQGYCHSCGYKWKTPDCNSMEDLLDRLEETAEEPEQSPPESKPEVESSSSPARTPGLPKPPPPKPNAQGKPPTKKRKARRIKANDLVNDIVAGIADPQLMEKYDIKENQLEARDKKPQ